MEFYRLMHLKGNHHTVNKQEILGASLLDLIFENRNKDYGAYALRRYYPSRLWISLGITSSLILFFLLTRTFFKNESSIINQSLDRGEYFIHEVIPPAPKLPEIQVQRSLIRRTASTDFVSTIVIKPNNQVNNPVPAMADLDKTNISDITIGGPPATPRTSVVSTGPENTGPKVQKDVPDFLPVEREPEFPGGAEGLKRFLGTNLNTPSDLEAGGTKTVLLRFIVGKDGKVSDFEIVKSGGRDFDREVLRVCKRMPQWRPAIQNGMSVPVSFVLPVTFISLEQ